MLNFPKVPSLNHMRMCQGKCLLRFEHINSLLMFSGPIIIDPQGRGLLVDGWVRLRGWARIGVLVSRLRMMLDDLLARKIDQPGMDMSETNIVRLVRRLVELDGWLQLQVSTSRKQESYLDGRHR